MFNINTPKWTPAQMVLLRCGISPILLIKHHRDRPKNPHNTKKGPGRTHKQGADHD